jgi:hypothetical protein
MEKDFPTRPLASAWILFAYGIVAALVAAGLAALMRMPLVKWWRLDQDVANLSGSEDIPAAMYLMPFLDLVLFLPLFAVLVPFVYADHHRVNDRRPIATWRVALVAALFAVIFVAILVLFEEDLRLLVFVAPTIILSEAGVSLLATIANQELTRGNVGAGGT